MKKYFYFVLVLAIMSSCLIACGTKGQNDSSIEQSQQDSLEAVKEIQTRIEEIYKDVFSYGGDYDYDEKYMSSEYKKLVSKAEECDEEFWMDDHWTQSQDPNAPFMKILSVERTTDTSAIVQIMVSDSVHLRMASWATEVKLKLIKENGTWLIDDFITQFEGEEYSEKAFLKEHIALVENIKSV